jgi:hypothetical protein
VAIPLPRGISPYPDPSNAEVAFLAKAGPSQEANLDSRNARRGLTAAGSLGRIRADWADGAGYDSLGSCLAAETRRVPVPQVARRVAGPIGRVLAR